MRKLLLALLILFTSYAYSFQAPRNNPVTTFYQDSEITLSSTPSTLILAADNDRKYLMIQNRGSTSVYLKFDATHTSTEGLVLTTGAIYEPIVIPTNSIYMKGFTGGELIGIIRGK